MRAPFLLAIVAPALLWAHLARAWDPSEKDCSEEPFRLTSFLWCDPGGSGCHYPEGALVREDVDHAISWRKQGRYRDDPATVRWALGGGVGWELNTTETHAIFNPQRIGRELYRDVVRESLGGSRAPNNNNSSSSYDVRDAVVLYSPSNTVFNVVEPMLPAAARSGANYSAGENVPYIWSDRFIVASSLAEKFFEGAEAAQPHKRARDVEAGGAGLDGGLRRGGLGSWRGGGWVGGTELGLLLPEPK
ncbi:uncharacterized protein PG986_000162 [Apiospora aurea]|uniref:Uncharacterized protein n=1 Tax=Apiospora aurea TaxID=335848 RepID=A0ABR1QT99_9PEZI